MSQLARLHLGPDDCGRDPSERAAEITADELAGLSKRLQAGRRGLQGLSSEDLKHAWNDLIEELADRGSQIRRQLRDPLCNTYRLSPECLDESLDALLLGFSRPHLEAVLERGRTIEDSFPAVAILAGNLPGLTLEPLLAASALRQPLLIKSSTGHHALSVSLVEALGRRLPPAREALAVVDWQGGDRTIEDSVLPLWPRIVAYGGESSLRALSRFGEQLIAFGPRFSIGLVFPDADPTTPAALARDIALFDQGGCLSVRVIWAADPQDFAAALATALDRAQVHWPALRNPEETITLQALRSDAELRGALSGPRSVAAGAVIVETGLHHPAHGPGEGLRSVVIREFQPTTFDSELVKISGLLQGAAIAGTPTPAVLKALAAAGVSRLAPAGRLQEAPAGWNHDGIDLIAQLSRHQPLPPAISPAASTT